MLVNLPHQPVCPLHLVTFTPGAGAAATGGVGGLCKLGGISSYNDALKELVLLPLQLPELFAK